MFVIKNWNNKKRSKKLQRKRIKRKSLLPRMANLDASIKDVARITSTKRITKLRVNTIKDNQSFMI